MKKGTLTNFKRGKYVCELKNSNLTVKALSHILLEKNMSDSGKMTSLKSGVKMGL